MEVEVEEGIKGINSKEKNNLNKKKENPGGRPSEIPVQLAEGKAAVL